MILKKKISYLLISFIVVSAISACSSGSINNSVNLIKVDKNDSILIADVGHGKKTGASITVSVNLANGSGFKTKNSSSGSPPRTAAIDLKSIKFWLVESFTGISPSGIVGGAVTPANFTPVTGGTASIDTNAGRIPATYTVTFTNVPNNSPFHSFYICASAYDHTITGGQTSANNITNLAAPVDFGGGDRAYTSVIGGDNLTPANFGSIKVTASALIPSTGIAPLDIPLKLLDGSGATIDSSLTITDGFPAIPPTAVH